MACNHLLGWSDMASAASLPAALGVCQQTQTVLQGGKHSLASCEPQALYADGAANCQCLYKPAWPAVTFALPDRLCIQHSAAQCCVPCLLIQLVGIALCLLLMPGR